MSELINALLATREIDGVLDSQLDELGTDRDWLRSLSDRYISYWRQTRAYMPPGELPWVTEHAPLLLSWILTPVRGPELLTQINIAAFGNCVDTYRAITGSSDAPPPSERLTLTVGVVGRPVGTVDRDFPVWFPGGQIDANAEDAYVGLLRHVEEGGVDDWPEVHRSAVLWRLGGVAQGLVGGTAEVVPCMKELSKQLVGALATRDRVMTLDPWLTEFRLNRNALTHVRFAENYDFQRAATTHNQVDSILAYLRLASFYVAASIKTRLSELSAATAAQWFNEVDRDQDWAAA